MGVPHRHAAHRLDADLTRLQRQHHRQVDRLAGAYNRELQARVKRAHAELLRAMPGPRRDAWRQDEEEPPLSPEQHAALIIGLAGFVGAWRDAEQPDTEALRLLFQRADTLTTKTTRRGLARVVGGRGTQSFLLSLPTADPTALRQDFIRANVDLIKSIDTRYFADIRRVVDEAYEQGRSWPWLAERLEERYDVSKSRAQLIARDQLGKLTSQIAQVRSLELGVESYQWLTSNDERVRETHERLAGRIFSWDEPPPVGHPGMDYQCRCTSRPVLSEAHARQLRTQAEARLQATTERLPRSPIVTGEIVPIPSRRISAQRIEQFRGEFRRVA